MEIALYDAESGYYTRAPYPSPVVDDPLEVDATRLLGNLLAHELLRCARALGPAGSPFTVIDAGAGDGRLSHAVLRTLRDLDPGLCVRTHLHLVERSESARHAQRATLTAWADHALAGDTLPDEFEGVLIARDLLGSMPAHLLVRRGSDLRELGVEQRGDDLVVVERPLSSAWLAEQAGRTRARDGEVFAVSPAALEWVADAARRLTRGFMLVIDRSSSAHGGRADASLPGPAISHWLATAGDCPMNAGVDFTAVRQAAEGAGCVTVECSDQSTFLVALAGPLPSGFDDEDRRAFTALTHPGGEGGSRRVLLLAKDVDVHAGDRT